MKEIRTVIIGFGGMGKKYAKIIAEGQAPGLTLQGICCRNQPGQQEIRTLYPQTALYQDVEDTFSHQEDFDAVVIATPHSTHVEIGKKAFSCGKHVFCEKPLGITAEAAEELAAAKRADTGFAVMFHCRTFPAFRKAKEMLDTGVLGHVTRAVWICNNWFRSPWYHSSASWRSSWNGEGGGLLLNQCQHYLDMWQWLFGMPDAVDADIDFGQYNDFAVDDSVDLRLYYGSRKDGRPPFRGSLISSSGEHPGSNRLEIWGTCGKLTVEGGKTVLWDKNDVNTDTFNRENRVIFGQPSHHEEVVALEPEEDAYVTMFRNFSAHLRKGTPLIAPGEEGIGGLLLANASYLSAWTGERVKFPLDEKQYGELLEEHRRAELEKG